MTTSSHRTLISRLIISLSLLAWITLGIWGYSPYNRFLSHAGLFLADFVSAKSILLILSGWLLMIIAIMLPTSLPLLNLFVQMPGPRTNHAVRVALLIAGYLFMWTLVGIVAVFADGLLHHALDRWVWFAENDWPIGASLFGVAGLYQLSPTKSACLDTCRSPMGFLTAYWCDGHGRDNAFGLGVRHGLFSVGCCWALIVLMFAIGIMNLGWLLVFGTLIAIEINISWGQHFRVPLGVLLLGCGLASVFEATLITS